VMILEIVPTNITGSLLWLDVSAESLGVCG